MKYYFFAASLPSLTIETPPTLTWPVFSAQCREQLNAADCAAVAWMATDFAASAPPAHAFTRRWHALETQLRNAVAARRPVSGDLDAPTYQRAHAGFRLEIEQNVAMAFAQDSPLDRERRLDILRWRLLEELGGLDPFATDAILAYAGRLRLSHRWANLTAALGRQRFDETTQRIAAGGTRPAGVNSES